MSERDRMINDFNTSARNAFATMSVPALLEAHSVMGVWEYRHPKSSFLLPTGFCIRIIGGQPLSKEEILDIGTLILTNQTLVRRLYALGWDTFYVEDALNKGKRARWAIKEFANMGNYLLGNF